MKRYIIAAYVENKYGVLTRVAGLFMRKGVNIDSLTVGVTDDPDYSRITITMHGDDYSRDHMINQLKKLHNVKYAIEIKDDSCVEREMMLIKVKNSPENRGEVMAASEIYRAKIIDYNPNTLCVELTGEPSKLNAFIDVMEPLGIIELCRTGIVALERNHTITENM